MSAHVWDDRGLEGRFQRDGFVRLPLLLGEVLERLRRIFKFFSGHYTGGFQATLLSSDLDHRRAVHEALAAELDGLLAEEIHQYRSVLWGFAVKVPSDSGELPLHQDISFLEEGGRPGITFWMPLVDVGPETACLGVVPGSHRANTRPRAPGTPFPYPSAERWLRRKLVELPVAAGTPIAFDQRIFHCSPSNRGASVRPAVSGVLLPREKSLLYFHRIPNGSGAVLEKFSVDDGFLLRHTLGSRPVGVPSLGLTPESAEKLTPELLAGAGE